MDVVLIQGIAYVENIALNMIVDLLLAAFTAIGSYLIYGREPRPTHKRKS